MLNKVIAKKDSSALTHKAGSSDPSSSFCS